MHLTLRDRLQGSLFGLATGDALGTTLEFRQPGSFEPISDIVGGGPFGLEPGEWTDDTSMALCLAESLIACQGFDPRDQMERYVSWWRDGHWSVKGVCFDIGRTTVSSLRAFLHSGDPWVGSTDPQAAGNGSLMRLAPVPIAFGHNPRKAIKYAGLSSKTTHGAATCIDACRFFAGLLVGAFQGRTKDEICSPHFSPISGLWQAEPLHPEVDAIARGSYQRKAPPAIRGSGYVVASLEAALWAFWTTEDFRSGALAAVNLGEDADTTGAIYGQIAGAFYGLSGIPDTWLQRLAFRSEIQEVADALIWLAEMVLGKASWEPT